MSDHVAQASGAGQKRRRCWLVLTCEGTFPLCNFVATIEVKCKPWWHDLPECPDNVEEMRKQIRSSYDRGQVIRSPLRKDISRPPEGEYGWCYGGQASDHENAHCYRTTSRGIRPGQQCCYNDLGELHTTGKAAGTPDKVGGMWGTYSDGQCASAIHKVARHFAKDVKLFGDYDDAYRELYPPSRGPVEARQKEELKKSWALNPKSVLITFKWKK